MFAYKYTGLLAAQILLSIVSPLFQHTDAARVIIDLAITAVFATAIYVISHNRREFSIGLVLMLPAFLSLWSGQLSGTDTLSIIALAGGATFFVYIACLIMIDIIGNRTITLDTIAGGLSVYLLIGNIWGFIFSLILLIDPGALMLPASGSTVSDYQGVVSTAMYYSFVTLTTLGYGDIIPVSAFARTMAYMEAVIGQFYITVLIASLVGMHIANVSRD